MNRWRLLIVAASAAAALAVGLGADASPEPNPAFADLQGALNIQPMLQALGIDQAGAR